VNSEPQITDHLTWPTLGANVSYGGYPDGQLVRRFVLHTPTPGGTNREPPLQVFINEWLAINTTGTREPADNMFDDCARPAALAVGLKVLCDPRAKGFREGRSAPLPHRQAARRNSNRLVCVMACRWIKFPGPTAGT
jgi:hypothetical protein